MSKVLVSIYRFGNWCHRMKLPLLPLLINYFNRFAFGVWLPSSANIGKNFIIGYGGLGVVIHDRTVIGHNCHIDQNVTIGGTSKKKDVPILGNYIYIGAGAKILGPISIGDNVVIGANAVITKSIPDGSLVVGVPGRIIKSDILKSDYV